jgi:DNA-binding PadR family transcriptional regulator
MTTGAPSFRYFVLGLLDRQPMSGYDIKRFLKRLGWLIGSSSFGNIYPALHALLEDGLVTVDVISQQDRPPRKVYHINESGRQELREWIEQPAGSGASLKTFTMRLLLASRFSDEGLIAHLQQRRTQIAAHRVTLEKMIGELGALDVRERLAFEYGRTLANAELEWLDGALGCLRAGPLGEQATVVARSMDTV